MTRVRRTTRGALPEENLTMTDTNDTEVAPLPCAKCEAKLALDVATLYCEHNQSLAVAERNEAGALVRFHTFGPMTLDEASDAIRAGAWAAAEKFKRMPKH